MTEEEKRLLLIDLCGRFPYGVKVWRQGAWYVVSSIDIEKQKIYLKVDFEATRGWWWDIEEIKLYLRPMSSMTDEERKDWYQYSKVDYDCEFKPEPTLSLEHCHLSVDWLNKKGFDYRGLIPMGLALEEKK